MSAYSYIVHSALTEDDLSRIIALKQQHWPYPEQQQRQWIERNMEPDDVHVLCTVDGMLAGYCDLVHATASSGGVCRPVTGIGNVCIRKQDAGRGWGSALVRAASGYLSSEQRPGVLLCKTELVPFYEKCGWEDRTGDYARIEIAGERYERRLMAYPAGVGLTPLLQTTLRIDRNF